MPLKDKQKKRYEYERLYRLSHKEQYSVSQKNFGDKWKFAAFRKFGSKCARCGFNDWRALQIDHVNGGGVKEFAAFPGHRGTYYRRVLEDQTNKYQLLCANCNWIKRVENGEVRYD